MKEKGLSGGDTRVRNSGNRRFGTGKAIPELGKDEVEEGEEPVW